MGSLVKGSLSSQLQRTGKQHKAPVENTISRPPKRRADPSEPMDNEEAPESAEQYVYVPECSRCRERGFVCRVIQGQHTCAPCRLRDVRCTINHEQSRTVKRDNIFAVKRESCLTSETATDMSHSQTAGLSPSPPSKRRRNMSDSASTAGSPSPVPSTASEEDATVRERTAQDASGTSSMPSPRSGDTDPLDKRITNLEKTTQQLRNELAGFDGTAKLTAESLTETIKLLRPQNNDPKIMVDLEKIVRELVESQVKANGLVQQLRTELSGAQEKADRLTKVLYAHQQKQYCEMLYTFGLVGSVIEAAESVLMILGTESEDVVADWLPGFTNNCIRTLERMGDEALKDGKRDETLNTYATALSLSRSSPNALLIKWVTTSLNGGSIKETLEAASKFELPLSTIYHAICDVLEESGRITEAIEFFREMKNGLTLDVGIHNECTQWGLDFQRRCVEALQKLADVANDSQNYTEAANQYSTMLSLDAVDRVDALIKRSKARAMMNAWEDALKDAEEVIKLYKPPHQSNEEKHLELVQVFEGLLLKFKQ